MDFRPDPELEVFRAIVEGFLARNLPAELAYVPRATSSARRELTAWQAILNRHGWGAPSWSKADGGTGWSVEQRLVFDEECALAGAPTQDGFAQKLLGPVLNHFGTPEQKAEHVPPILAGERLWSQGFSEPGAGSDLASLRTRAERQGDSYVLNGQKIWSSYAHRADWMFVLARTDPSVKKHAGITFFLVDLKTPGISVRPIISIDGRHHLNETFFTDVRVPAQNVLGAEGQGWAITKFLLNNEHAVTADLPALKGYLRRMMRIAIAPDPCGVPLIKRSEFAARIAAFETELMAVEMMVRRAAAMHGDQGKFAHAFGSMLKIRGTELQQRMSSFLVEMLGSDGAVACGSASSQSPLPGQDQAAGIAAEMFFRRASTIYGGASEVQRGIIAKLMFGF